MYTEADIAGLGKGVASKKDILRGETAYSSAIRRYALQVRSSHLYVLLLLPVLLFVLKPPTVCEQEVLVILETILTEPINRLDFVRALLVVFSTSLSSASAVADAAGAVTSSGACPHVHVRYLLEDIKLYESAVAVESPEGVEGAETGAGAGAGEDAVLRLHRKRTVLSEYDRLRQVLDSASKAMHGAAVSVRCIPTNAIIMHRICNQVSRRLSCITTCSRPSTLS
jgi:hypothetical protein